MQLRHLIATATLALLGNSAMASSLVASTDAILGALTGGLNSTSDATSSLADSKVVQDARDDAAQYVGTAGQARGAHLEAALQFLRSQSAELNQASDLQLAEAIISH